MECVGIVCCVCFGNGGFYAWFNTYVIILNAAEIRPRATYRQASAIQKPGNCQVSELTTVYGSRYGGQTLGA